MDYANWPQPAGDVFRDGARSAATGRFCWAKRDGGLTGRIAWARVGRAREAAGARPVGARHRAGRPGGAGRRRTGRNGSIADLAIMSIGAVTVPAYTTNTVDDHRHILGNSGARAAIVSTPALAERLLPAAGRRPSVRRGDRDRAARAQASAVAATAFLGRRCWPIGDRAPTTMLERGRGAVAATRRACLIYTSGTGGVPKGVMLPPPLILGNCRGAYRAAASSSASATRCSCPSCRCRIPTSTPPG